MFVWDYQTYHHRPGSRPKILLAFCVERAQLLHLGRGTRAQADVTVLARCHLVELTRELRGIAVLLAYHVVELVAHVGHEHVSLERL